MSHRAGASNGYAEYDERHTDENHPYDGSGLAPRTCTDLVCLVIFIVYMVGMGCVLTYAFENGNPQRLTHGFDYKGELCGVDEKVADKPMLYWCGAGTVLENGVPSALDLEFPTCVAECPEDISNEMACLGVEQVQVDTTGQEPFITEKTTITQSTVKQMSYPTMAWGGLYCIPRLRKLDLPGDDDLTVSLLGPNGPLGTRWAKVTAGMGGLRRCWPVVACAMIVAIALGYGYLFLLNCFAKPLVEGTLITITVGLLLTGAFFLVGEVLNGDTLIKWQTSNYIFRQYDLDTARSVSRCTGIIFTVLGLCMLCGICAAQDAIRTAIGCVEAACECIFTMPSMLLQPLIEAVWKLVLAGISLYGLAWLLSTADMVPDFITVKGEEVGGLTRSLVFNTQCKLMVIYYVIGTLWLFELSNAMSQFVISYSVVLWYYTPKPKGFGPHIPLVRGFIVGVVFHLGTLAMGAFLISVCRLARIVLGYIAKQGKQDTNKVCEIVVHCLGCCITCFQKYLEYINKNAYIDVCISSTSFCTAAKNSFGFIASEGGKVLILTGACFVYCVAGVLGISGVVALLTYMIVTTNEQWTSADSPNHVADPFFVSGVAAILAGSIALCFMVIFDHTADTLLYTYVWNKSHGHNTVQKYSPESLAILTEYKPISKPNRRSASGDRLSSDGGVGYVAGGEQRGGMFSAFSSFFSHPSQRGPQSNSEESQSLMQQR